MCVDGEEEEKGVLRRMKDGVKGVEVRWLW